MLYKISFEKGSRIAARLVTAKDNIAVMSSAASLWPIEALSYFMS